MSGTKTNKQRNGLRGGGVGLAVVLAWVANLAGVDVPPGVIEGVASIIGIVAERQANK